MKKVLIALLGISLSFAFNASAADGPTKANRSQPTLKPGVAQQITKPAAGVGLVPVQIKGPIKPLGCAIDPGVDALRVARAQMLPDGTYMFWLDAAIKNFGTAQFSPSPGQAKYILSSGNRVLKSGDFGGMVPGGRYSMGMNITGWRLSDEFPPDFTLQIVYDPDILQDGNANNDDCRMSNNRKVLTGQEVMQVLRTAR